MLKNEYNSTQILYNYSRASDIDINSAEFIQTSQQFYTIVKKPSGQK